MTNQDTFGGLGLIIRFAALVLTVVATAVIGSAIDTTWALVLAVVIFVGLLLYLVVGITRFVSVEDGPEPATEIDERPVETEQRAQQASAPDGTRVLVLAGEAAPDLDGIPDHVRRLLSDADHVFVVTPALTTRLQWLASDVDGSRAAAEQRLSTIVWQLRDAGISADGAVGDDMPLTVAADHVRRFAPDHIVVSLRSAERAGWQEQRLLGAAVLTLDRPLTIFEPN